MLHRYLLTCCALLLLTGAATAQRMSHLPGQLIVQLGADVDAEEWALEQTFAAKTKPLGRATRVHLLYFDHDRYRENDLLKGLRQDTRVILAQFNHPILPRRRPNDTRYDELWDFNNVGQINGTIGEDMNIEPAWDVTTGGLTRNGDTIVVAILDDGTDLDHEDLVANLWRNHTEIPNNGVDDDNNGYVDDYYGYDTQGNDGDPNAGPADGHGTPPAGIIGAVGNNNLGVTGINWSVKIMTIRNGFLSSEAEVIQAYGYALDERLRYERTNGASGAYVVATNSSWGRNFGDVNDSPIWCSLYDLLGRAGILSMGAVANLGIDVDVEGDLPTNCPSDYLIGVTNLDTRGRLVSNAGRGAISVDLAAHGQDVFTTANGNGYGRYGGTSSATPHVTGAAALLYAAPCAAFGELLAADPAAAARYVKGILLATARPNPDLAGVTVSGGRLDVGAAMSRLMSECGRCFSPTSFAVAPVLGSTTSLVVSYNAIASLDDRTLRYRQVGATAWVSVINPPSPLRIDGLEVCAAYEFELSGSCGGTATATVTTSSATQGCCAIPDDFAVVAGSNLTFIATWTPSLAGRLYRVRYRRAGTDDWRTRTSNNDMVIIAGGIDPCSPYEFEFRTDCDTSRTEFGARLTVLSRGCGACLEETYCELRGNDNSSHWIDRVNFGNQFTNQTGRDARAIGDYTASADLTVARRGVYPVTITPGSITASARENFRIYVDWNQDGVFSSFEIVGDVTTQDRSPATINITVPESAQTVSTRMRVMMNFIRIRGSACIDPSEGEYEDYCLQVTEAAADCPPPTGLTADFNQSNGATLLNWPASAAPGNTYVVRYRPRGSGAAWVSSEVEGISKLISGLNLCGGYEVELASKCGGNSGVFSRFFFSDTCVDTDDTEVDDASWTLSPNPATELARLDLEPGLAGLRARLYSATGGLVRDLPLSSPTGQFDVAALPAGLYFVELLTVDGRRGVKKLLVR